jgi:hypothetical protein
MFGVDVLGGRDRLVAEARSRPAHSGKTPATVTGSVGPGLTFALSLETSPVWRPTSPRGGFSEPGDREVGMWWGIGFGGLLYVVLLITLGVMTLRNGHGWLFFFGIFLPFLWIIGAIMRPTRGYA